MNNNNDDSLLPFQKLDIYRVAKELARLTQLAGICDAELNDQATRAAKSAFLNLCEGLPSDASGIRRRHFEIANNSLHEHIGAVDLSETIDAVDTDKARELLDLAVRFKRMLRKLPR
jgi:four helix bundle protein